MQVRTCISGEDVTSKERKTYPYAIMSLFVLMFKFGQVGGGTIKIGKGSEIGERCRISIANMLTVGEKVLLSPNIYITDCDHEYRDIHTPVIDQGIVQKGQNVSIGDGSYIGINVVIIGNIKIGKHSVVGANSVVTKDVPDYSVAVGSPAQVIKTLRT